MIYNLGEDEIDIGEGKFVIYQGSHGDRGAHRADIILPSATYTEESGLFVNMEGRVQSAQRANFAPGEAKENWAILRALSAETGTTLPYDTLAALRRQLIAEVPHLGQVDQVPKNSWMPLALSQLSDGMLRNARGDFYMTNPLASASLVMAELSAAAKARLVQDVAAE